MTTESPATQTKSKQKSQSNPHIPASKEKLEELLKHFKK